MTESAESAGAGSDGVLESTGVDGDACHPSTVGPCQHCHQGARRPGEWLMHAASTVDEKAVRVAEERYVVVVKPVMPTST